MASTFNSGPFANTNVDPWTRWFNIYHPVSKKQYDLKFDEHPFAAADSVLSSAVFHGVCNTVKDIYFDARGAAFCLAPDGVALDSLEVTLSLGDEQRRVLLEGITGQVKIQ